MIQLLFFAGVKETIGKEAMELEWQGQTIAQVKEYLLSAFPSLSLQGVMVAVNEEFAMDEDTVEENDTIAFIPPVSGG
ncbi:molybdopterin converting factor subunit 1 [Niallia circulans]|uniref:Molybdopterin synthase sulfur carrier subunit n=1 Tax=Niallia circulans TaxID=1397 RepID=A0A0J1INE0_NIACI|nr:molybdopterin converting factor subunit 1 [Niallia circulans]KLV27482.1 molybdenum cofactor biosynthesis protein MoaD [Niallia circulans]MCM2981336.1 molybdopterin converting factor subunit 1 [Niallia circulans]MDR4316881.1 molybdopterin converting factor subunit 1 [Niallia circulans]MED3840123.1 molybdopterin converting factor subunit 1 [Niallia circulans]MED4241811.1 molybdopterin converting factor subunit 1 [Niallia circulans]